jgi:hypothetical protein
MILFQLTPWASMMQTIYASICGALILIAALIPPAILILDKAGF